MKSVKWILVAALLVLPVGCISKAEYAAFVDAADKYNQEVSPHYLQLLRSSAHINSQSIATRETSAAVFSDAISAAKERLK